MRGSVLTTRADLNCFDFRCFPIVGVAEPLGDGLLLTSRPRPIHPAGAGDQTAHNTRIGP